MRMILLASAALVLVSSLDAQAGSGGSEWNGGGFSMNGQGGRSAQSDQAAGLFHDSWGNPHSSRNADAQTFQRLFGNPAYEGGNSAQDAGVAGRTAQERDTGVDARQ